MAIFLLYLSLYFILVTDSSGGVYIYSCCGYCGCYRVIGAAIRVASNIVIKTTSNTVVKIASKISKGSYRHY